MTKQKHKKYFGTDGIRGRVGDFPINAEFMLRLGWAVGRVLSKNDSGKVLIGKDTRISGYMFESALEAGLSAAGVDIHLLGPMPTPAIAYLTRTLRAKAGIVISASHNPYHDNGVKFFSPQGSKLPDELEEAIEEQLKHEMTTVDSVALGKATRVTDASGRYVEFCKSTLPHYTNLNGMKIVVDCANGATYDVAPHVLRELGATVTEIAVSPNGFNINAGCGSTCPEFLQKHVIEQGADIGIAFDGDGDRVIMVDSKGEIIDGDEIVYIIAKNRMDTNRWQGGVVGTQMSNLGLELALKGHGIEFIRTSVGDRYVMAELERQRWSLGGEPSGHVICFDMTSTGDAIVSALQVLYAMSHRGLSLHELKSGMQKFPQTMINVNLHGQSDPLQNPSVTRALCDVESQLNGQGRVLLRLSGTEPVVRVMVEGEDAHLVANLARGLADVVKEAF